MKKRNPRVLLVCPLPPPVHGSSMVSSCIRESRLINGAFDVDCVNISTSRGMAEIGRFHFSKIWRFVGSYFIMLWKLLTHRYDLVYLAVTVHGIGFLKDCPYMLMARLFCRNRLIHHHNKGMAPYAGRFPYNWLMPMAYRGAKVMLLSERLYEDISGVVKREDIIICPNGLKDVARGAVDKVENGVPNILFLSNLIASKGVYALLDACKVLKNRGVEFRCSFVGGETKSITKNVFDNAVGERGLEEWVEYVGPKYGEEKETYWNNADMFVFPSFYHNECMPLTVIEAMQHGIPVVTTDEGAIPDLVVDGVNGFVISSRKLIVESGGRYLDWEPSEDIVRAIADYRTDGGASGCEVLADRLECLIRDPELRRRMGDAGRKRYEELFTLEVFEERVKEAFNIVNE